MKIVPFSVCTLRWSWTTKQEEKWCMQFAVVFSYCFEQFISSTVSNEVPQSIDKIISTFICVKSKPQCACISVRNSYHSQTLHDRNFMLKKFMFYVCVCTFFRFGSVELYTKMRFIRNQLHTGFHSGKPQIIQTIVYSHQVRPSFEIVSLVLFFSFLCPVLLQIAFMLLSTKFAVVGVVAHLGSFTSQKSVI